MKQEDIQFVSAIKDIIYTFWTEYEENKSFSCKFRKQDHIYPSTQQTIVNHETK
jgi:hypothetical protein